MIEEVYHRACVVGVESVDAESDSFDAPHGVIVKTSTSFEHRPDCEVGPTV